MFASTPGGTLAFTPGGVGYFVKTSRVPWATFPELKAALPDAIDDRLSSELCSALQRLGLVGYADAELAALVDAHTIFDPSIGYVLDVPVANRPSNSLDLVLCKNLVVTAAGYETLGGKSR